MNITATMHDKDLGVHVRTIMQGLILAGIIGVVGMLWRQNEATATQNVTLAQLQVQVSVLQQSLAGLPDLSQRVMRLETSQADLMRRQAADDTRWERLGDPKLKGWTR